MRVTPEEVHILDPPMYHKLFVSSAVRKTDGYGKFWNGTGFEGMISMPTHYCQQTFN